MKLVTFKKMTSLMALVICLTMVSGFTGCSHSKEVKSETVQSSDGNSTTMTKTEVEEKHDNPSVLGTAFNFIGEVIALPFRLVGNLFSWIF